MNPEDVAAPSPDEVVSRLALPVGQYLGPITTRPGELATEHLVRVRQEYRRLPGGDLYSIWLVAHGLPTAQAPTPWTLGRVAAASGLSPQRFTEGLYELIARGLLIVVDPAGPEAVEVAKQYRWSPLLWGYGTRLELLGKHGIGLPSAPWLAVTDFLHNLWRWLPVAGTLWGAAELFVEGSGDEATRELLATMLGSLHPLLAGQAGYLDVA